VSAVISLFVAALTRGSGGPHVLHDCLKAKKASKKKTGKHNNKKRK
jgi:hypothetical protein